MKTRLIFLYIVAIILSIIILVLAVKSSNEIEVEKKEGEEINFESSKNIKLLRSENEQIEEVNLNYYLLCTVASEIPFKYEYEAIKAQVVVARTYLFNKIVNNLEECGDVCDDYRHCQAFTDIDKLYEIWKNKGFSEQEIEEGVNKIKRAIVDTEDEIITYKGEIINALFHASSPRKTEDAKAIWSNADIPYLKSVDNIEDEDYENRETILEISYDKFKSELVNNGYIDDLSKDEFLNTNINDYTQSGRVNSVNIGKYCIKAENLRTIFNIKSTDFTINFNDENTIVFDVLGFGHGVGMSQVGANTYARRGKKYDEIIHHYYTDVDIVDEN